MIAVDTSALVAILLEEPEAAACGAIINAGPALIISSATVAEALVVADRRRFGPEMRGLIDGMNWIIEIVDGATAGRIAEIYSRWGKGVHPASLNIIDCFAYDVARQNNCSLLFVGNDFTKTDINPAITAYS
jgi:ribonuclease VapC